MASWTTSGLRGVFPKRTLRRSPRVELPGAPALEVLRTSGQHSAGRKARGEIKRINKKRPGWPSEERLFGGVVRDWGGPSESGPVADDACYKSKHTAIGERCSVIHCSSIPLSRNVHPRKWVALSNFNGGS